jgi:N-methylhydantoinase A
VIHHRPVRFTSGVMNTPVYARDKLDVGHTFTGPAIVDQDDTTVVVLPGQRVRVDPLLNLFLSPVDAPEETS